VPAACFCLAITGVLGLNSTSRPPQRKAAAAAVDAILVASHEEQQQLGASSDSTNSNRQQLLANALAAVIDLAMSMDSCQADAARASAGLAIAALMKAVAAGPAVACEIRQSLQHLHQAVCASSSNPQEIIQHLDAQLRSVAGGVVMCKLGGHAASHPKQVAHHQTLPDCRKRRAGGKGWRQPGKRHKTADEPVAGCSITAQSAAATPE